MIIDEHSVNVPEAIQPSIPGLGIHKINHLAELTRSTMLDVGSGLGPSGRRFTHDLQTIAFKP